MLSDQDEIHAERERRILPELDDELVRVKRFEIVEPCCAREADDFFSRFAKIRIRARFLRLGDDERGVAKKLRLQFRLRLILLAHDFDARQHADIPAERKRNEECDETRREKRHAPVEERDDRERHDDLNDIRKNVVEHRENELGERVLAFVHDRLLDAGVLVDVLADREFEHARERFCGKRFFYVIVETLDLYPLADPNEDIGLKERDAECGADIDERDSHAVMRHGIDRAAEKIRRKSRDELLCEHERDHECKEAPEGLEEVERALEKTCF